VQAKKQLKHQFSYRQHAESW